MSKSIKVAVIGAGSAQFSLGLIRDLSLTESLAGSQVSFWDVDAERLDMVCNLAGRFSKEIGAQVSFLKSTSQAEALAEADFVINTALAGGHTLEERERSLLEANGYYRGVRLLDSFHQFDLMLDIARDMEKRCPNAWLLQVSNPVFEGTTMVTRHTGVKAIGLCHGHYGYQEVAEKIGLDPQKVEFEAVGVNHCIWMTHFRYQGEDAYPLLNRWIAEEAEAFWSKPQPRYGDVQMSRAAIHLYHFYGLMPIGDTARTHWPEAWWYNTDFETKKHWYGSPLGGFDSTEGWSAYLAHLQENIENIQNLARDQHAPVTQIIKPEKSDEQIVPIMDALVNDKSGLFQVNVPNLNGALPGYAGDVVVEVPAIVDGKGIRPLRVDPLPKKIDLGVMQPRLVWMERALAAYTSGDADYLLQMLLNDHRTRSLDQAKQALSQLLEMPGNERFKAHFKR